MDSRFFQNIIIDNQNKSFDNVYDREIPLPKKTNKILSFLGIRRSGKTFFMYSIIKKLRQILPKENIVYLNLDDDRINPLTTQNLSDFIEAYYELFPQNREQKVYFFFDEVQQVENWEKFIRRLYDTENCQIFISGSSAKLLKNEIAYSLRGRTLPIEVFPLSFREFLYFNQVDTNYLHTPIRTKIKNLFNQYLKFGGFPELLLNDDDFKINILQSYIDLIIYRDIIERFEIRNLKLVKFLIKYSFTNIGTLLSINKLYNDLKSRGLKISKDTVYDYFGYFQDVYALFLVPKFDRSISEQIKSPQKLFAVDVGFKTAVSPVFDIGHRFENIVFTHLRRKYSEIFYWKDKHEVDFLYFQSGQPKLINVCYDFDNTNTRSREIAGLVEAMTEFGVSHSFLITSNKNEKIQTSAGTIYVLPLWLWLLQGEW